MQYKRIACLLPMALTILPSDIFMSFIDLRPLHYIGYAVEQRLYWDVEEKKLLKLYEELAAKT